LQANGVEHDRDDRNAQQHRQHQHGKTAKLEQCIQAVDPSGIELHMFDFRPLLHSQA